MTPGVVRVRLVCANPELIWCDTLCRGYMAMTITADRATNEWIRADMIKRRCPGSAIGHRAIVMHGRHVMATET